LHEYERGEEWFFIAAQGNVFCNLNDWIAKDHGTILMKCESNVMRFLFVASTR